MPAIKFKKIECELPQIDKKDLSKDQKYLYEISEAISTGFCDDNLLKRDPGPICHSRWLTTANRILRVYVGSPKPSAALKHLTEFILKVYCPLWFMIKQKKSVLYGPKILMEAILRSRYLPKKLRDVVDKVIANNAFFAHPENLLLGMIVDERRYIREKAMNKILAARKQKPSVAVRKFEIPSLNFSAADYTDMIIWPKKIT